MVGAMSARRPSWSATSAPRMRKGTGLVVWPVWGVPSAFQTSSALPWSAVTMLMPPASAVAFTVSMTHLSVTRTASRMASQTQVWPTMSQLA